MAKHKPPTKNELAEWAEYGSYAGQQLQVCGLSCLALEKVVVGLRETLYGYGKHDECCASHNFSVAKLKAIVRDKCNCGLDKEINT